MSVLAALVALAFLPILASRADESAPSARSSYDHARHAPHVPECSTCHRYAAEASPGAEVPAPQFERPAESDCTGCHPFDRPSPAERVDRADPEVCGVCHALDERGRISLPAVQPRFPALDFDHRAHDQDSAAPCSACHDAEQLASRATPSMQGCMTCHDDALDGGCAICHLHDEVGRLIVDRPDHPRLVPTEWMGDLWHGSDFDTAHGVAARTKRDVCDSCHEPTFCEGCHLGEALEQRFHPAGWITLHGAAERSTDLDCETCHRGQEMCLTCHRRAGVSFDSPELGRTVPRGLSFHADTWSSRPEEHARDARRNLESCVSCHSAGDCLVCHASGPSPHGPGWGSRCSDLREVSPDTCLVCHATVPACR
ncbi:MAG: hypothetical protein HY905_23625 [Deltaproteobacteria bacterium]|nr:hypothetical protein [Deltaproteobacteria bacterium]